MTYIIGEIGLNHNGALDTALDLIDAAKEAGCDAVKFQKRTPEECTPKEEWYKMRETPWGRMSYIDYRHRVEFGKEEYDEIDAYCKDIGIDWFASVWDKTSVEFLAQYNLPYIKIPSAKITDIELLKYTGKFFDDIIISTGMSNITEISTAVRHIGENGIIMHCTSTYPCELEELNLNVIKSLKEYWPENEIGYSGHEVGLATTVVAVALGATFIERHITLDRTMWGTDQSASVEPQGLRKLVKDIRSVEKALGDGVKKVYDSELPSRKKLRGGE